MTKELEFQQSRKPLSIITLESAEPLVQVDVGSGCENRLSHLAGTAEETWCLNEKVLTRMAMIKGNSGELS